MNELQWLFQAKLVTEVLDSGGSAFKDNCVKTNI